VLLTAASAASTSTAAPDPWQFVASALTPLGTLAGALVGWLAATLTARGTAARARQDEQRRWNRERREKAYVALLDARNELAETRRAWDQSDPPGQGEFITYARERARDELAAEQSLREALAVVELIGSATAVEMSRRWVQALCPPRPARRAADAEPDTQDDGITFRDPWVALIRKELGVAD
jgi:hypothetical protein